VHGIVWIEALSDVEEILALARLITITHKQIEKTLIAPSWLLTQTCQRMEIQSTAMTHLEARVLASALDKGIERIRTDNHGQRIFELC
jgi:hypothetical protein